MLDGKVHSGLEKRCNINAMVSKSNLSGGGDPQLVKWGQTSHETGYSWCTPQQKSNT